MVDRGLLDYKEKVVKYWPEFGENGKQDITVEQLFSHQVRGLTTNNRITLIRLLSISLMLRVNSAHLDNSLSL